jgi:pimeloyl-ACP methyl ester carboxylesterase
VTALLEFLKIDKADILGFSNGGQTTMQIGISYPSVVNKLVIISAFYKREGTMKGFFEGMTNANLGNMPAPLKEAYLQLGNDSTALQRMFDRDKTRMLEFKDWNDEELATIKAPAFIIAGDKDVVTPEHAAKMSRLIPNAQLMILPGTHGSFIGEICTPVSGSKVPERTVAAIEEFLQQ